jgi:hypothetical protein
MSWSKAVCFTESWGLSHLCLTRSISLHALDSKICLVDKLWGVFSFHQSYTPPQFILLRDDDILVDTSRCGERGGILSWDWAMSRDDDVGRPCMRSFHKHRTRAGVQNARARARLTTAWRHTPRAHPRTRIFVFLHHPARETDPRSFLICELAPPHELLADRAS